MDTPLMIQSSKHWLLYIILELILVRSGALLKSKSFRAKYSLGDFNFDPTTTLYLHDNNNNSTQNLHAMSVLQNGAAPLRAMDDESDVEEEALVADYREQVQYEGMEELEQVTSLTMAQQTDDIQSRLAAAAQPLDFSAPLEVKFASYDNYCSLFHFILNSDGPVDLEPPSVRNPEIYINLGLI